MQLHNLSVLNHSGRSRSFDQSAGGYGRGEGCGVVVLKLLDAAIRDGDPVRAIIRASGVNSDGWTKGIMVCLRIRMGPASIVYKLMPWRNIADFQTSVRTRQESLRLSLSNTSTVPMVWTTSQPIMSRHM